MSRQAEAGWWERAERILTVIAAVATMAAAGFAGWAANEAAASADDLSRQTVSNLGVAKPYMAINGITFLNVDSESQAPEGMRVDFENAAVHPAADIEIKLVVMHANEFQILSRDEQALGGHALAGREIGATFSSLGRPLPGASFFAIQFVYVDPIMETGSIVQTECLSYERMSGSPENVVAAGCSPHESTAVARAAFG